jgi:hypothetical protein
MKKTLLWTLAASTALVMASCEKDNTPGEPNFDDDAPAAVVPAKGFYVVNEDWYGHDVGSVNKFALETGAYKPAYRIFRAANPEKALGTTTQFATIWGENAFFCSKQGARFVVADANTMKAKQVTGTFSGDGRAFVGLDDKKGYVSHSAGLNAFDIATMTLNPTPIVTIAKTGGHPQFPNTGTMESVGNLCVSGNYLFFLGEKNIRIIDTRNDEVVKTIAGTYQNAMTRSKDGNVWVAARANKFIKINPETLETEEVARPVEYQINELWGAWNDGGLCASTQTNTLYWKSGTNKVVKYDIDSNTTTPIYTLGQSDFGRDLQFYGAGLRVDPLTDNLVMTVTLYEKTENERAFNWIYILDANGNEKNHFEYFGDNGSATAFVTGSPEATTWNNKYFWFPAMPFFEDANKPQIVLNQIKLKTGESKTVDLAEKIVDHDNSFASIQTSFTTTDDGLATISLTGGKLTVVAGTEPGQKKFTLSAISNGVRVEKTVRVDIVQ